VRGDGDGWVRCGDGQRRWGRHGAAGLLLRAPGPDPADPLVLLQLRVGWSHHGGTWGIPGGARNSHETATMAALREATEETGIDPHVVGVRGELVDDLGGDPSGWTYTTVVADVAAPLGTVLDRESDALQWVPESAVTGLGLHPGLRASWPLLRARPVGLVVDVANVVGSVPDGWWRDRAAASTRLLTALAAVLPRTVRIGGGGASSFDRVGSALVVLEGAARSAADVEGLTVLRAVGSGDDAVVEAADRIAAAGAAALVVSADRGLLDRLPAGTASLAPSVLRSWLD
jgi:8-oxo-dGTP diphosphatase